MRSARCIRKVCWLGPVLALALPLTLAPGASGRPAASSLRKLDYRLQDALAVRMSRRAPRHGPLALVPLPVSPSGGVYVDVYVNGTMRVAARALRGAGMAVRAVSRRAPERMVEGWLPVSALASVARLRATRAVLPVEAGFTNVGSVTSQGDAAHHAPQVRAAGPTGAGIPVGIMSDSINQQGSKVAGSQASGDLPADVQVLDDTPGGSDEGRAMAEIVYDEAPGIPTIYFARGVGSGIGPAGRAANIDALVSNGANVIADDTVFLTEPMFQDGVVAQAADRAKANGTAYFVSAGNRARQSWQGTFTPGSTGTEHNFAASGPEDLRQTVVSIPAGKQFTIVLGWDEALGAVSSNLAVDLYLLPDEAAPVFTFNTDNPTTGVPLESGTIVNTGATAATISIGIRRISGTRNPLVRWVAATNFATFTPSEHNTGTQAIDPDAASARGTLAVGAVAHNDPGLNSAEAFSSRGPAVTRFFDATGNRLAVPDVRPKPDIAGADGVATSVPGFSTFFGTSAAAPSAAGVGALLLSAKPALPIDELYAIMRDPANAIDCSAPGFPDADCGSGFILADSKLAQVLDATPPVVTSVLSPAAPDGANGWYHGDVGLTWAIADDGSPIGSTSNCGASTVTTDTVTVFTCAAMSAGGTTNQPVEIKRDGSPPTAPVIAGISAKRYSPARVPPRGRVTCTATDSTSGVPSCTISGYSSHSGRHTITATATNEAGLTSVASLRYTVLRPPAASRMKAPRSVGIATLLRSGLPIRLRVATNGATVDAKLFAGRTAIGHVRRRLNRGSRRLTLELNAAGRRLLQSATSARLVLVVTATGRDAKRARLRRGVTAAG